jgi:hypothetical protein
LKPHASQNWPILMVPHRGHDSPAAGGLTGLIGLPWLIGRAWLLPMRMPQTSQKSSLAES